MLTLDLEPMLADAVAEVLESMCFLSIMAEGQGCEMPSEEPWICGMLTFEGACCGSFGVAAPPETARAIAANFLGEDEAGLNSQQTAEVIGEFANMACGALLGRIDAQHVFTLSAPQATLDAEHAHLVEAADDTLCRMYQLDEGLLKAWCAIKRMR